MRRIDELDWLRGLMALSILFYHCASFVNLGIPSDASTVLGKLGIYGVSIFFILSGLSMAYVYHASLGSYAKVGTFFVRRAFRIWPLLFLVVLLRVIPAWMHGQPYSLVLVAANATGLFGFFDPTAYINVGAWSIGNEMVFYALTPVFIFAYSKSKILGNMIVSGTVVIGLVFAFVVLDASKSLSEQWGAYVNPFNNLFLFAAGVSIFYNLNDFEIRSSWRWPLFLAPIVAFAVFPAYGDQIHIVTGAGRLWFTLMSALIVVGFYKATPALPPLVGLCLEKLGLISYGVYLLHPFVIGAAGSAFGRSPSVPALFVFSVGGITIASAAVVYALLERPAIKLGKAITSQHGLSGIIPIGKKRPT